jgi:hypothetical protein
VAGSGRGQSAPTDGGVDGDFSLYSDEAVKKKYSFLVDCAARQEDCRRMNTARPSTLKLLQKVSVGRNTGVVLAIVKVGENIGARIKWDDGAIESVYDADGTIEVLS